MRPRVPTAWVRSAAASNKLTCTTDGAAAMGRRPVDVCPGNDMCVHPHSRPGAPRAHPVPTDASLTSTNAVSCPVRPWQPSPGVTGSRARVEPSGSLSEHLARVSAGDPAPFSQVHWSHEPANRSPARVQVMGSHAHALPEPAQPPVAALRRTRDHRVRQVGIILIFPRRHGSSS